MTVFERRHHLGHPPARLFGAVLEDLPRLAALLPHVERIEPLESRADGAAVVRRDRWFGASAPLLLEWFLPSGAISWVIVTTFRRDALSIDFQLEPTTRPLRVTSEGTIRFDAAGEGATSVRLSGSVTVGRPQSKFGAGYYAAAEELLASLVCQNLESAVRGAGAALAEAELAREHGAFRRRVLA